MDKDISEQRELERLQMLFKQNELLADANAAALQRHQETLALADRKDAQILAENMRYEMRLSRAANIVKGLLYTMPSDPMDLPMYFESIYRLFDINSIDEDLRMVLKASFLSENARKANLMFDVNTVNNCNSWKCALLKEHRLSPRIYRITFQNAVRESNETCVQFNTRLTCLLKYYVDSRNVNESYEKLFALILSDRIKDTLGNNTRYHIADRERKGWMSSPIIAEKVDIYESERGREDRSHIKHSQAQLPDTTRSVRSNTLATTNVHQAANGNYKPLNESWKSRITCYNCSRVGHLQRDCPLLRNTNAQSTQSNFQN